MLYIRIYHLRLKAYIIVKAILFKSYYSNHIIQIILFKSYYSNHIIQIILFKSYYSNHIIQIIFKIKTCYSNIYMHIG